MLARKGVWLLFVYDSTITLLSCCVCELWISSFWFNVLDACIALVI